MSTLPMSRKPLQEPSPPANLPWWRFPIVWLVIGGPATVVVAGLVTFWIAARDPDPIVGDTARSSASAPVSSSQMPAQQARNHAATPR